VVEIEFTAEVIEWRGPAPFYFLTVPKREAEQLRALAPRLTYGWGMVPVTARIGEVAWTTSLWPKEGTYVLPLKVKARTAAGLALGDLATVTLMTEGPHETIDRAALIDLVARVLGEEAETEEQEEAWLADFARAVPHPRAIDLVLYPEVEVGEGATAERIVDVALAYRD
jgi:hypothetical protein